MAVTGYTWLTLVINCNNEVCSPSNNTVSKAFWWKKVLPEQKISYCEGIYIYIQQLVQPVAALLVMHMHGYTGGVATVRVLQILQIYLMKKILC